MIKIRLKVTKADVDQILTFVIAMGGPPYQIAGLAATQTCITSALGFAIHFREYLDESSTGEGNRLNMANLRYPQGGFRPRPLTGVTFCNFGYRFEMLGLSFFRQNIAFILFWRPLIFLSTSSRFLSLWSSIKFGSFSFDFFDGYSPIFPQMAAQHATRSKIRKKYPYTGRPGAQADFRWRGPELHLFTMSPSWIATLICLKDRFGPIAAWI